MPILLLLITIFVPRFVILTLYFFSEWFSGVFSTWLIPILGFIFTPYTMLWYSVVHNWYHGIWGMWQVIFLVVALLLDISQLNKKRK